MVDYMAIVCGTDCFYWDHILTCQSGGRKCKNTHNIPYITTDLPIGPKASERFLHLIGEKLGIDRGVIDKVIEEENEYYNVLRWLH